LDERPFLAQVLDHLVGGLAHDDLGGVDPDVGKAGGLRGGVDAGAVGQLACACLAVEALHVLAADQLPGPLALGRERRDHRDQHDESGVGHQRGHLGHPPDVLHPVGVTEPEVSCSGGGG
jgi:hypothetical protein